MSSACRRIYILDWGDNSLAAAAARRSLCALSELSIILAEIKALTLPFLHMEKRRRDPRRVGPSAQPQTASSELERLQFLFEELLSMQVGIETVFAQRRLVRAAVADPAGLQHADQIVIHAGCNPGADE